MSVSAHWADSVHHIEFVCRDCGDVQLHELRYAGRLLASSECLNCGAIIRHEDTDLRRAYLRDLELRLRSKPKRMMKRVLRHPAKFMSELPYTILVKPAKLLEEARPLFADFHLLPSQRHASRR